jgi:hypothetical protein
MQRSALLLSALALVSCKPPNQPTTELIAHKCSARAPDDRPLIVAWENSDKALIEAQRAHGLIAVRYIGCEMKVLTQCGLPAKYEYMAVTTKHDHVNIESADELVAKLPIGAATVAAKLESTGKLSVDMLIVGRFEAARKVYRKEDLEGDCSEATHMVSGITVGAFDFAAGAEANVNATVGVLGAEIGGKHREKRDTVSQDGNAEACKKSGADDKQPPFNCGGLLRLELIELKASAARCGPGLEWDGQGCVQKVANASSVTCPDGTKWNGEKCIAKVSTECAKGMHFEAGKGCVPGDAPATGLVDDH